MSALLLHLLHLQIGPESNNSISHSIGIIILVRQRSDDIAQVVEPHAEQFAQPGDLDVAVFELAGGVGVDSRERGFEALEPAFALVELFLQDEDRFAEGLGGDLFWEAEREGGGGWGLAFS